MAYSGAAAARQARENLGKSLAGLQEDPNIPPDVLAVAQNIAQAVGALFEAERASSETDGKASVKSALGLVSQTLALLQEVKGQHRGVELATETIAGTLSILFPLSTQPSRMPPAHAAPPAAAPAPAAVPQAVTGPMPAHGAWAQTVQQGPQGYPAQQPAYQQPAYQQPAPQQPAYQQPAYQQPSYPQPAYQQPAYPPAQQPAYPPAAQPAFQQPAYQSPQQQPAFSAPHAQTAVSAPGPMVHPEARPAYTPEQAKQKAGYRDNRPREQIEINIGATTESNFFVGFSGDIAEGGVFAATYNILPKGTPVRALVTLPGGFEREVLGHVRFVRDPMDMSAESEPGMGIQFESLVHEARELILRFIRKRPPIFYDE
jgi:uncharacterized protein (TIGR02266 family)